MRIPVVIFNHGLYLHAEQSTVLAEELASQGYAVLSIGHPYESTKINLSSQKSITPFINSETRSDEEISASALGEEIFYSIDDQTSLGNLYTLLDQVNKADTQNEIEHAVYEVITQQKIRAQRQLTYENLTATLAFLEKNNQQVAMWVKDIEAVLTQLNELEKVNETLYAQLDINRLGVIGMSRGGAAAVEYCRMSQGCNAVINFDGLQFGSHWRTTLNAPLMVMYSSDNVDMNLFSYQYSDDDTVLELHVLPESSHADFSDLALIVPMIHSLDTGNTINAKQTIKTINHAVLSFLQRFLK